MRLAAVDLGTNSTRMLVADVDAQGRLVEVVRRSTVTRLGAGVDATGRLDDAAVDRVLTELAEVRALLDRYEVPRAVGVLTSAVRDASNGPEFVARVRDGFGIDGRAIPGEEEAALTYRGATGRRAPTDETVAVVDVGGGSTEVVVGRGHEILAATSLQLGVVRQSERHLHHDPPEHAELVALGDDVRATLDGAMPDAVQAQVTTLVATAGTATSCAAMAQALEVHDPALTHGYVLALAEVEEMLARLAQMGLDDRRQVTGLQPQRAPTIVAGCVMLAASMRAFGLHECETSEDDILQGVVLAQAAGEL